MSLSPSDPIPNDTIKEIAKAAEATVKESLAKIGDIAQSVDAVNLFVAMFANMALGQAEHMSEATHGIVPAKLELLAYHIFPFFGNSKEPQVTPWHTQLCWEAVDKLFISRIQYQTFSQIRTEGHDQIDYLLNSLRSHLEIVRGSAYPEQTKEEIISVQGNFNVWFARHVGISPSRAVDLLWAIVRTQEENVNAKDFIDDINDSMQTFGEVWEAAKRKHLKKRSQSEHQILSTCADKKTARIFGYVKRLNELSPLRLPVIPSSLKFINPLPSETEWKALCGLIGLSTETRKEMHEPIEVRQRPLFVLPDKGVLLADISNALDCLWERFEQIAKSDQDFYDKHYQRRKANWLEDKVLSLLKRIFPPAHVYHNLSYPDPDKPTGSTVELDFAVLWPPFIVLAESKARQFRIESQLGDPGRLRTDIKANVEDAYEQAKRALRYISSTEKPEFLELSTGRKLSIEKNNILRIYLLTVSQHHLAGLVNRFAELKGLGLFKNSEYPVSICLADIEIITEFCSGPDIFLHYLEKRIEVLHEKIDIAADELDFFGAYLSTRLRAERLWKQGRKLPDTVHLGGWSEKFDQIMEHRRGERKEPPSIELEVPQEIKDILSELRRRHDDPNARWIAFSLLGMSDAVLNAIAQGTKEVRAATLTPGMFRRVAFQDGDTAISIVASIDLSPEMLRDRTKLRAILEKYRRKTAKSIGIGIMVTDTTRPFDCAVWVEGRWEFNKDLEKALDVEPPFMLAAGQKLPGRNEPCICGSGRKFKKCCLRKIEIK